MVAEHARTPPFRGPDSVPAGFTSGGVVVGDLPALGLALIALAHFV